MIGVAVLALIVAAALAAAWLQHVVKTHGLGPVLWRFFSGHSLDGKHRTDATWNHPATKVLHPTGRVVRWHHWRRRRRAAIRAGTVLMLVVIAAGLARAPRVTVTVLLALATVIVAAGIAVLILQIRAWKHQRHYVGPLRYALTAENDGVPPAQLEVARDRTRVAIGFGTEFTGSDREREAITRAVCAKLAIEAPDEEWKLRGRTPQVTFTQSKPPPATVTMKDILPAIISAQPHEVVAGIGRKNEIVKVSVDNDSPHIGLSMISGDGKSTVAKNFAAQMLHHGALLLVLDYKMISHQWARGLPNVAYASTPAEIHELLLWLEQEIQRRNKVARSGADIEGEVHADVGPRLFVVAEELNATQGKLRKHWRTDLGGKGTSPAAEALDEAMFIGRQVRCNILQIGQRLSVKATSGGGSGDARENLGLKVFCDPSASTWKMLVGDDLVRPPASGHRGRLLVVSRRTVREVQGAFWTGQEAHDFALAGTVAVPRYDMPLIRPLVSVPDRGAIGSHGADQPFVVGQPADVPGLPGAVTIAEAVDAGLLKRSLGAARKASQRDESHPKPVAMRGNAHLYDIEELYAYEASKARVR